MKESKRLHETIIPPKALLETLLVLSTTLASYLGYELTKHFDVEIGVVKLIENRKGVNMKKESVVKIP